MKNLVPVAIATIASMFASIDSTQAASCQLQLVNFNQISNCPAPNQNRGFANGSSGSGDNKILTVQLPNGPAGPTISGNGVLNDGITLGQGPFGFCVKVSSTPTVPAKTTSGKCNTAVKLKGQISGF